MVTQTSIEHSPYTLPLRSSQHRDLVNIQKRLGNLSSEMPKLLAVIRIALGEGQNVAEDRAVTINRNEVSSPESKQAPKFNFIHRRDGRSAFRIHA